MHIRKQLGAMILGALLSTSAMAGNSFEITGDFEASSDEATARIFFNEPVKIWMLQLSADGNMVTLFFSRNFTPGPGTFPVQFNYLGGTDVLGGSVIVRHDERVMLSFDTEGEVTFERFDDQITGTFEFTTYDGSDEPRRRVQTRGAFEAPRGDAMR